MIKMLFQKVKQYNNNNVPNLQIKALSFPLAIASEIQ